MHIRHRRHFPVAAVALFLTVGGCAGPAVSSPADAASIVPKRKVHIVCESVELRDDAPPESREKVVSRPRATTLVGRPVTVAVNTTRGEGDEMRLATFDMVATEVGDALSLQGEAKFEVGGVIQASAKAPVPAVPTNRIALRLADSPGLALELRCIAGDPPTD